MTNVPESIRDIWKDIYILFDTSYNMTGTEQDWLNFWETAKGIYAKCPSESLKRHFTDIIAAVADLLSDKQKDERMPTWKPNEPYPYPKEE